MADSIKYGLTESGFNLKRLRAILDDTKQKMQQVTDPDSNEALQIDWEENDPFIQYMNLVCDQLATIWELLNAAYDQFDPLKATGPMLSSLVQLNGITRKIGTQSTVDVLFTCSKQTTIPANTQLTNIEQNILWLTEKEQTIDNFPQLIISSQNSRITGMTKNNVGTYLGDILGLDQDFAITTDYSVKGIRITADFATIKAITDGSFKIYIGDTPVSATAISFASAQDFQDVANILQTSLSSGGYFQGITVTVNYAYQATIPCLCSKIGAFEAKAGTINTMVSPIVGVTSVVNEKDAILGTPSESDIELRRRREKSTETPSQGIAESIYGSIIGLEHVEYCKIFTNRSLEKNSLDIPGKNIAIVVQVQDGYEDDEDLQKNIAKNIFLRAGLGEEFYNRDDISPEDSDVSKVVSYEDSFNQITQIKFLYPKKIPIYVKVSVTDMEGSQKSADFIDQIKNNIIQFAKYGVRGIGIVKEQNIFEDFGFPPSENIDRVRLYTPINAVAGIKVLDLQIGTERGVYSYSDIPIDWWQVGQFIAGNIDVEYSETQYQ